MHNDTGMKQPSLWGDARPGWTVADAIAAKLCPDYTHERLVTLLAGRERLSAADVAALPIPATDRLWALLRMVPRERWMPAIWAAADRACRVHLPRALRGAGLGLESLAIRLEALPPVCDPESAWSASESARSAARRADLGAAESAAESAAECAAWCAESAAKSAWSAAESAWSADLELTISDIVRSA